MTTALVPLPGRDPYATGRVCVYKNLHRGCWSVRACLGPDRGKVVAHATVVGLAEATMHVSEAARIRIANGHNRTVHAWIVGRLTDVTLAAPRRITYRPHHRGEFYLADTGQPIWLADQVLFTDAAYIDAPR